MERPMLWRGAILLYIGGMVYTTVELLWRGWSHPSMFIVGGLCFLLIGAINENVLREDMPLLLQAVLGAAAVTLVELVAGLILNVWLGLDVWDYSSLPLNLWGQICLWYFLLWIPLALVGVFLDDLLRHALFGEPKPRYRWVGGRLN